MKTFNLVLIFASLALLAGCDTVVTTPVLCTADGGMPSGDAAPDAGSDAWVDPLLADFSISVIQPVELVPGEETLVYVQVDRAPGFTAPILLETSGLPDAVFTRDRENRPGEVTILYLSTDPEGPGDFRVPRFTISGTDPTGLRHSAQVDFEVATL